MDTLINIVRSWRRFSLVTVFSFLAALASPSTARADEVWQPLGSGMSGGSIPWVFAMTEYNGNLIAGGYFTNAGGQSVNFIARWDGATWHSMNGGMGITGGVQALTVYNGELIAGGTFTTAGGVSALNIARWNGVAWMPLGSGLGGGASATVNALTVYKGELIAGGSFTIAGGASANRIARWNGTSWQPLESGLSGGPFPVVRSLTVHNGQLIAGGSFTTAGGVSANYIASWNGTAWQALGSGMSGGGGSTSDVLTLSVYNGELIAGGYFTSAGGVSANRIARWNGSIWQSLGSGMNDWVQALSEYNGELIAGGWFVTAGGVLANRIARWNGTSWQPPIGIGMNNPVHSLSVWNGSLVAGGRFESAGGQTVNFIALSSANSTPACQLWQPLGSGMNAIVNAVTTFNSVLIAGGSFTDAGGTSANYVARWNGSVWQGLGSGMNSSVLALGEYNNELIAGGFFTGAGGSPANRIARWNGTAWLPLGEGIGGGGSLVTCMAEFNGELIVGGFFTTAGGVPASNIARWNGVSWSPLDTGLDSSVSSLVVYNGELIACGGFTMAGSVVANRIARWDGSTWQAVGSGMSGPAPFVYAVSLYNGELIAGGQFNTAGGVSANNVARWNGSSWQALGQGMNEAVNTLIRYNDTLIAGGRFTTAGILPSNRVARWNGVDWQPLGSGMDSDVFDVGVYDGRLIAAGQFISNGSRIAAWHPNLWFATNSGLFNDNRSWEYDFIADSPTAFGLTPGATPFVVTFRSFAQSSQLCISNQRPVFNLGGFQYSITNYTTIGGSQTAGLTVNNGTLNSPVVAVGSFGTLAGNGQINGNLFNVGTVRPGPSPTTPGVLTLSGNYEQPFGIFEALIGEAQHSQLNVGVQASLAGTLKIDLAGNPKFQQGQMFPILTCGVARQGQFEAALLPDIGQNLVMNIQYDPPNDGSANDGPPSLVGGGGVTIVVGTPSGSPEFGAPETFGLAGEPTGIVSASVGAVPGRDLALSVAAPSPSDPGNALILLNQGDGSFFTPVVVPVGREPSGLAAANLAGAGGDDDFAIANRGDDTVSILRHQGGGVFNVLTLPVGESPSAIAAGDLRGLGLIDLAVTNQGDNSITLLLNDGVGGFSSATVPGVGSQPRGIAIAQLVGGALPELVVANIAGNTVTVLINQGGGSFTAMAQMPVGQSPTIIDPADVDNDRDLDLVIANLAGASFSMLLNQGNGQFGQAITLPMLGSPLSISSWDMDTDGDVDLVAVIDDDQLGPVIQVLRNDLQSIGEPLAFTLFDPIGVGEEPRLVRGADVTGDLSEDLIAVNISISPLAVGASSALAIRPNLILEVPGDIAPPDGDGIVNVQDLLAVISAWGACPVPCPPSCTADLAPAGSGGDCTVNVQDLLFVIANWG